MHMTYAVFLQTHGNPTPDRSHEKARSQKGLAPGKFVMRSDSFASESQRQHNLFLLAVIVELMISKWEIGMAPLMRISESPSISRTVNSLNTRSLSLCEYQL